MSKFIDDNKSIEELEQAYWRDHDLPTSLVAKCHEYRKIPLKDLAVEQIRLLVGQNIGLEYLIPKALVLLKKDILTEGDYYPGDLLHMVLASDENFWKNNKDIKLEIQTLLAHEKEKITNNKKLLQEIDEFMKK